jgi:hypothetical protein
MRYNEKLERVLDVGIDVGSRRNNQGTSRQAARPGKKIQGILIKSLVSAFI